METWKNTISMGLEKKHSSNWRYDWFKVTSKRIIPGLTYDMAKAHFVAGKALKVGEVFDRIASYGRRCLHLHWMEGVAILDNEVDLMPFRIAVEPDVAQTPPSVHVAL